ncbi:glycoside hydrolase family 36 protein [Streptomyces sp. NPDC002574]|uniref:glycoside hydrolase family 36 protein n=1 Tax=Streptomyces sp. NPDC002574 TaxID=3364652 RepID=UPI0036D11C0E
MYAWGDLTVRCPADRGVRALELLPTALAAGALPGDGRAGEPLATAARAGDAVTEPYAAARTLRRGATASSLRERAHEAADDVVTTELATDDGLVLRHRVVRGDGFVRVRTSAVNEGDRPLTLELLSSFTLGGLTVFAGDPGEGGAGDPEPGRHVVHRLRCARGAEARLVSETVERLGLERPRDGAAGTVAERFGATGLLPVVGWLPFLAVEDTVAGVVWGVQLAASGPWQMELLRSGAELAIGGGPADAGFGGWRLALPPGGSLHAPEAVLSVVRGGLDELCHRLTSAQSGHPRPGAEPSLPVGFTVDDPSHDRVLALADRLAGTPVRHVTLGPGWYGDPGTDADRTHGDWEPSAARFPDGLAATAGALRERGFVPGLWWEPETTGELSKRYGAEDGHVAHLPGEGTPAAVAGRRLLDLRRPEVAEPLVDRMTAVLRDFGYLTVDCGADLAADGETSRQLGEAAVDFLRALAARLPDLVIENRAGGGRRVTPAYTAVTALSYGTGAVDAREIPVVAANLHRVLLPRQSLVPVELGEQDDDRTLVSRLAAGFLGRMSLSGDPARLDAARWALVRRALALYERAAPVIADGISLHGGTRAADAAGNATGCQSVLRVSPDGLRALAVLHTFADPGDSAGLVLPEGLWTVDAALTPFGAPLSLAGARLRWHHPGPWAGAVALLSATRH